MKINLILLMVILIAGFGSAFYFDQKEKTASQQSAPNFTASDLDGNKYSFHDNQGQNIILHFWATWCAPCLVEFPDLIEYANDNPKQKIVAVAVQDKTPAINRFLRQINKELPNNFHIVLDPEGRISKDLYNVHQLPESFVIFPSMTIKKRLIGTQDNWDKLNLFQ